MTKSYFEKFEGGIPGFTYTMYNVYIEKSVCANYFGTPCMMYYHNKHLVNKSDNRPLLAEMTKKKQYFDLKPKFWLLFWKKPIFWLFLKKAKILAFLKKANIFGFLGFSFKLFPCSIWKVHYNKWWLYLNNAFATIDLIFSISL